MANRDQESRNTADDALELNKETLQDLDLEPADAENVKGGTGIGGSVAGTTSRCRPAFSTSLTGDAMTSAAVSGAANPGASGFRQI